MRIHFATPPRRILIIKPSSLGDVTHGLPVLNLLRSRWPESHISWLVTPACAGLLEGHPSLDRTIPFERRRLGAAWRSGAAMAGLVELLRELRHGRFDLVVDLQGLFRSGWLAMVTGAAARVGFGNAREFAPLFYTHRVPVRSMETHALDRNLQVAAALGCGDGPVEYRFRIAPESRRHIEQLLPPRLRYAVLLPGANWVTKRWPADRFAALVQPLGQRFGLAAVVAGGPDAAAIAPQIPGAIDLTNRTTIPQLIALLDRADLVIANDSGPMHIAAALGRPLVALFGPTNPIRTGPHRRLDSVIQIGLHCAPCYQRSCCHTTCLQAPAPAAVLALAEAQLARRPSGWASAR